MLFIISTRGCHRATLGWKVHSPPCSRQNALTICEGAVSQKSHNDRHGTAPLPWYVGNCTNWCQAPFTQSACPLNVLPAREGPSLTGSAPGFLCSWWFRRSCPSCLPSLLVTVEDSVRSPCSRTVKPRAAETSTLLSVKHGMVGEGAGWLPSVDPARMAGILGPEVAVGWVFKAQRALSPPSCLPCYSSCLPRISVPPSVSSARLWATATHESGTLTPLHRATRWAKQGPSECTSQWTAALATLSWNVRPCQRKDYEHRSFISLCSDALYRVWLR